jgi:hypothetical protein
LALPIAIPEEPPMKRAAAVSTFSLLAAFATLVETASARSRSSMGGSGVVLPRSASAPLMAVISLNDQRITVYDALGKILQAPVSTGRRVYETPAGVYSILEKNREHYSNLYDDASMPFMQRITWSGIALHAGALPGYPASHGCIRLPHRVAEQLFELTKIGMRVVVVREDMHPVEIAHPALFKPGAIRSEVGLVSASGPTQEVPAATAPDRSQTWRSTAKIKLAQAQAAARAAEEASSAAAKAKLDAARLSNEVMRAEGATERAEVQLKHAERMLGSARSARAVEKAESAKVQATDALATANVHVDAAKAEAQPKIDAAEKAQVAASAARAAKVSAQNEAKLAEAKTAPVSVFISRKTQRLYVRQGFMSIFDVPISIRDPETPIGTTIYTALNYINGGSELRWSALSMYPRGAHVETANTFRARRGGVREPAPTDPRAANAALDRISIPQDALERINAVASPGSSLGISDEPMSSETGKGTDFVVLMSGEPQGGIKIRPRNPSSGYERERAPRRSTYYGRSPSFSW